ncbi:hypothetical protein CH373_05530 [Leptospira perolatii]|uniref:Uncharacterized protein n=1 Tax=Leptospira perolatii TaxID=2023191 RepID=A0A2M9ZQN2_9LEPT|nr:hypothetical protein CH360_05950 [Leptospira perolatii]PJZ74364.1 hypothetical protein CH373_05530 [Leptospira perolatii]
MKTKAAGTEPCGFFIPFRRKDFPDFLVKKPHPVWVGAGAAAVVPAAKFHRITFSSSPIFFSTSAGAPT